MPLLIQKCCSSITLVVNMLNLPSHTSLIHLLCLSKISHVPLYISHMSLMQFSQISMSFICLSYVSHTSVISRMPLICTPLMCLSYISLIHHSYVSITCSYIYHTCLSYVSHTSVIRFSYVSLICPSLLELNLNPDSSILKHDVSPVEPSGPSGY